MSNARLNLYVTPKSSSDGVAGWRGGELQVKVTAVPEEGKANAAACKLLAKRLGIPKSSVTVVRGHSSRHKQLLLEGVDESAIAEEFGRPKELPR